MPERVHFAWTRFQRRQWSMREYFAFEVRYVPLVSNKKILKGAAYLHAAAATLTSLWRDRPMQVWMQLPQVPLLLVALLYRRFIRRDAVLIADCHNSLFRPPWSRWPALAWTLNRCDIVLVHNDSVQQAAIAIGVAPARLRTLGDAPAQFATPVGSSQSNMNAGTRRVGIFPASFSSDEPIQTLVSAARLTPGVEILVTGRPSGPWQERISTLPSNVRFLDYLARMDFERMLLAADFVVALTSLPDVQLSACNEAVGARKPMLLSDTPVLRRLFSESGVFVNSSSTPAVAEGLALIVGSFPLLASRASAAAEAITMQWERSAEALRQELISLHVNRSGANGT